MVSGSIDQGARIRVITIAVSMPILKVEYRTKQDKITTGVNIINYLRIRHLAQCFQVRILGRHKVLTVPNEYYFLRSIQFYLSPPKLRSTAPVPLPPVAEASKNKPKELLSPNFTLPLSLPFAPSYSLLALSSRPIPTTYTFPIVSQTRNKSGCLNFVSRCHKISSTK